VGGDGPDDPPSPPGSIHALGGRPDCHGTVSVGGVWNTMSEGRLWRWFDESPEESDFPPVDEGGGCLFGGRNGHNHGRRVIKEGMGEKESRNQEGIRACLACKWVRAGANVSAE